MLRSMMGMVLVLVGCLAYGAVFVKDTNARIADHALDVHRPKHTEVTVNIEPAVETPVVVLPEAEPPEDQPRDNEAVITFAAAGRNADGSFVPGDGASFRAIVSRDTANPFLVTALAYVEERRQDTKATLDRRLRLAFDEAFIDRQAAASDYADWFYGWGNSFAFLIEAIKGAGAGISTFDHKKVLALAKAETEGYMLDHYKEIVLKAEIRDPAIVQAVDVALREAHSDYQRVLRNVDQRLLEFIIANARYVEPIDPSAPLTLSLDWDAQKWKARTGFDDDAVLIGIGGVSLILGGQMLAPIVEEMMMVALSPIIGEMIVTAEFVGVGALLGTEVPVVGNLVGAVLGLGADYLFKLFHEKITRDQFEARTLEAIEATISQWHGTVKTHGDQVVDIWFDELITLMAASELEN